MIIKKYSSFLNEKLFKDQYDYTLNLKIGSVIYAKEDFNLKKDVDFSKLSFSKIGEISSLNFRNWLKGGYDYSEKDWYLANKGDILAVVLKNGSLSFTKKGWVSNINDKDDYILLSYNILYKDNKIGLKDFDKSVDAERKIVFYGNLNYILKNKMLITEDERYNISFEKYDCDYSIDNDILYVKNAFDLDTGRGGFKYRIQNASKLDSIKDENNNSLNDI